MRIVAIIAVAMLGTGGLAAGAAELRVLSSPTFKTALEDVSATFERDSGHKLSIRFDGVPVLKREIEQGAAFDLAILLPAAIDDLVRQSKIAVRADLARTAVGIAVRAGAPKLDLSTAIEVKRALLSAARIAYSAESASGAYFISLLGRLDVEADVRPRLISVSGRSPVDAVAAGEADITVITVPNIVGVPGVDIGGLLPAELQNYTTFTAGVGAGAKEARAAEDLIKFLRSPAAVAAIQARGFQALAP